MLLQQASSSPGPSGGASAKLPPSPRPNPSPSFSSRLTGSPILSDGASSSNSPKLGANSPKLSASPKYGSPRLGSGSPRLGRPSEDEAALEKLQAEMKEGWTVHTGRDGRLYYCNHVTRTASWLPPAESWWASQDEEELPYGWEEALDSQSKPYYINHLNKTTTYVAPEGVACEPPPAPRDVELERDPELGFGFVAGSEKPVLVRFVTDNSPSVGKLEPGDQILMVNGEDVVRAAREHVISAVRACTERVRLRVCQPARAHAARRSALLSAAKRARLRVRPCRVRFADSVQVNGAPLYPPSAFSLGDLCLPPMANVLKVFLENGQTKSFKYDTTTTVADVVASLKEKLCITAGNHFCLVVEHVKSLKRNKLTLLDPNETLARIASRPGSHKMRCLFRVVFMPESAAALAQEDLVALDYLYTQCCNDVAQERFAPELGAAAALRLAALHLTQHAACNNLAHNKMPLKAIEADFGLERFVPGSVLESMKRKQLRRALHACLKLHQHAARDKQLTQLQAKLHYLDIVSGLPSFGAKCFSSLAPDTVLLVSRRYGLSQIRGRGNPQSIAAIDELEGVTVTRSGIGGAEVTISLSRSRTLPLHMDERDATQLALVLAGYYKLVTGKELNVEQEREPMNEDIAPPYLSSHNVVAARWSYLHHEKVSEHPHYAVYTMPPPYHATPSHATTDTNMNSLTNNKNHSCNASPILGYDGTGLYDGSFDRGKEEFRLFDPNETCYLEDGMGFDLQSVLSMELLENSDNPRLVEARNEEVLRRVAEMQKLVENSEQYLTENCDVYNDDDGFNSILREELVGRETCVDQVESDTESNNSRMSSADDAPGILKHSDSLLLLTETINQGLNGLTIPEPEKVREGPLNLRQSQGLSAILNNCGLTDALIALNSDLSHSESDNDSSYTPNSSPIRRNQPKPVNKAVRTSFGLHSPDPVQDTKEPSLKEYLKQLREKSSREEAVKDTPYYSEDPAIDNDAELIDLTLIPPPQTPDELDCATQVPQILPVVPPSFADERNNSIDNLNKVPKASEFDEFLANATVPPPTVRVTPAKELTPEEIMSYIIPPPPGSNSSTLDRDQVSYVNHAQILEAKNTPNGIEPKPANGEVVKGNLSVSEIRNIFTAKSLSDARNSLLLKEKTKADSPKGKRKSVTEKQNGTVIDYPTVERKGMFSCCSKEKNPSEDEETADGMQTSDSMPDVCEIRPPPRRKNFSSEPPERPPKTQAPKVPPKSFSPTPCPRPRSNSLTCPELQLSAVEIPEHHFNTLNDRRLNYRVVCEMNGIAPPLPAPPSLLLPPRRATVRGAGRGAGRGATRARVASIGGAQLQRDLAACRALDLETRATHTRSHSDTKPPILKNKDASATLYSPQSSRRRLERPDLLSGTQQRVRFLEPAGDVPPAPAPPRALPGGAGGELGALLRRCDAGLAALLARLHTAADACRHHHAHGGGEDIDEVKFQRARGELTSCAVTLVGSSRTLVGALGGGAGGAGGGGGEEAAQALAECLAPLRRLADLSQALERHTSSPLQTRNLILRVYDVMSAFKDLAGAEMAQIIHEHDTKHANKLDTDTTLEGQLALRAECLANVLATLLRSLRVFSP